MLLARTETGLAGAWFEMQKHHPGRDRRARARRRSAADGDGAPAARLLRRRERCASTCRSTCRARRSSATSGRRCCASRPARRRSYGEIARELGLPSASRAVGAAVGRNPVSIIVPCHRVVGSSGALTGYAGGLDRKTSLLRIEAERVAQPPRRAPAGASLRPRDVAELRRARRPLGRVVPLHARRGAGVRPGRARLRCASPAPRSLLVPLLAVRGELATLRRHWRHDRRRRLRQLGAAVPLLRLRGAVDQRRLSAIFNSATPLVRRDRRLALARRPA